MMTDHVQVIREALETAAGWHSGDEYAPAEGWSYDVHDQAHKALASLAALEQERDEMKALTVEQGKKLVKMHSLRAENTQLREALRSKDGRLHAIDVTTRKEAMTESARLLSIAGMARAALDVE